VYVLAATVIHGDTTGAGDVRAALRQLLPTARQRAHNSGAKLHWYDEDDRRRQVLTERTSAISATTHVAICLVQAPRKDERSRALCLQQLLGLLPVLGVDRLILERREPALNKRDVTLAVNGRRTGVGVGLRVEHGDPRTEELLWLPDAVAGAYTTAHLGAGQYWDRLAEANVVQAYMVTPR